MDENSTHQYPTGDERELKEATDKLNDEIKQKMAKAQDNPDTGKFIASKEESWHYKRTCAFCNHVWGGLHCIHDRYQNPCPNCGETPIPVETTAACDCKFDWEDVDDRITAKDREVKAAELGVNTDDLKDISLEKFIELSSGRKLTRIEKYMLELHTDKQTITHQRRCLEALWKMLVNFAVIVNCEGETDKPKYHTKERKIFEDSVTLDEFMDRCREVDDEK
jgi:hypothetical protein